MIVEPQADPLGDVRVRVTHEDPPESVTAFINIDLAMRWAGDFRGHPVVREALRVLEDRVENNVRREWDLIGGPTP